MTLTEYIHKWCPGSPQNGGDEDLCRCHQMKPDLEALVAAAVKAAKCRRWHPYECLRCEDGKTPDDPEGLCPKCEAELDLEEKTHKALFEEHRHLAMLEAVGGATEATSARLAAVRRLLDVDEETNAALEDQLKEVE